MLILPVMLLLLSGGSAKVVLDFQSECGGFFHHNTPPTVFPAPRFRQICQAVNNVYHYATLYDTQNKIPVYSAYLFTGLVNCERNSFLAIEPQLENFNTNMALEGILHFQASNRDYQGSGFYRELLAPVSLANSQQCADATFTLTNAAPQNLLFNRNKWRLMQFSLNKTLSSHCTRPAYILTGAVPGLQTINNRVKVPSHFWTAYCCQQDALLISGGVIGENKDLPPVRMNVRQLETSLKTLYRVGYFSLFDNNCKDGNYIALI